MKPYAKCGARNLRKYRRGEKLRKVVSHPFKGAMRQEVNRIDLDMELADESSSCPTTSCPLCNGVAPCFE